MVLYEESLDRKKRALAPDNGSQLSSPLVSLDRLTSCRLVPVIVPRLPPVSLVPLNLNLKADDMAALD